MSNDVTWWQSPGDGRTADDFRNQNDQNTGNEIPGDEDAPDIVGRTGEEMPEVAHDSGEGEHRDDATGAAPESATRRNPDTTRAANDREDAISPLDPSSMPRADEHPGGLEDSQEFTDRPGQGNKAATPPEILEVARHGQLGPDELSDPVEVVMNQEAKLHH